MSKKNRVQRMKSPRTGGRHLQKMCDCSNCTALQTVAEKTLMYAHAREGLLNAMLLDRTNVQASRSRDFEERVILMLHRSPGPILQSLENLDESELVVLPGYAVLCREGLLAVDAASLDAIKLVPLDIWGMDFSDGGLGHLQEVLANANADAERTGNAVSFSLIVWVTGYAPDMPVHVLAAGNAGEVAGGFLQFDKQDFTFDFFSSEFMSRAMQLFVEDMELMQEGWWSKLLSFPGGDLRLRPGPERYLVALDDARIDVAILKSQVAELKDAKQVLIDAAEARFQATDNLHRIEAEVQRRGHRQRLKDALRAQADSQRAQVVNMNAQAAALRSRVAQLESELAEVRVVNPAAAEVSVLTAIAEREPDEAATHWRETASHQAEVMRQMRIVMTHMGAARADAPQSEDAEQAQSTEDVTPRRLSDILDWAAENADRVILLSRAVQGAKKSKYEDEGLIYAALDLIATTYRDVKLGVADRMAFKEGCQKLGLELGGSITEAASADYFFNWGGRNVFLDQGVARGNSRDPRYCLRIYFTWLPEEGKVVIGWLPSHLPTRDT